MLVKGVIVRQLTEFINVSVNPHWRGIESLSVYVYDIMYNIIEDQTS